MYKTYSFTYSYSEIEEILKKKGYNIITLSKIIDLIPELKSRKKEIFRKRDSRGNLSETRPSAFNIKFAVKYEDLPELIKNVEILEAEWTKNSYFRTTLCKNRVFQSNIRNFFMENVLGEMIAEQIKLIIK